MSRHIILAVGYIMLYYIILYYIILYYILFYSDSVACTPADWSIACTRPTRPEPAVGYIILIYAQYYLYI